MTLTISATLSLPRDAVTSTIVVYGGKGMGKTNLASVLVEEFAAADLRFVVIDPMGVWWGLRHSTDGKRDGIKVLILGGIHGHLPIAPDSGALVADLVVEDDANVIIDISRRPDGSMWAISERIRFVRDYAKRLYQRQGEARRPIHQVIDEAARFAPQIVRQGEQEVAACMGAIAVLVEEGRNVGIGVTLVTQRSARLNKDVAELADCMIAFRIVGPNSMRAVLDWLGEHIDKSRLKDISEKVRSLPRGSALVVSPGWLEFEGIAAMRKRTTFDSSKTPEAGEELRASGPGAAIDVSRYRERFAKLIEEQKANDPVALRAKLAAVEKRLAAAFHEERVVEVPVLSNSDQQRLTDAIEKFDAIAGTFFDELEVVGQVVRDLTIKLAGQRPPTPTNRELAAQHFANDGKVAKRVGKHEIRVPAPVTGVHRADEKTHSQRVAETSDLEPRLLRILTAVGWWHTLGIDAPDMTGVAFIAGYSPSSSGFEKARGMLRSAGLVDYPSGGTMRLTDEGRRAAPPTRLPREARELHAAVLRKLEPRHGRLLTPLIDVYPKALSMEQLASASGYSASSSGFEKARGTLRSLGLADYPKPGHVRAADLLFPDGAP